jgi:hypothetical protein
VILSQATLAADNPPKTGRVLDDATIARQAKSRQPRGVAGGTPRTAPGEIHLQYFDSGESYFLKSSDSGAYVANQLVFDPAFSPGDSVSEYSLLVYNDVNSGEATVSVTLWDGDPLGLVDTACAAGGVPAPIPGTTTTFSGLQPALGPCSPNYGGLPDCQGHFQLEATLDPPVPVNCNRVWMVMQADEGCRVGWRKAGGPDDVFGARLPVGDSNFVQALTAAGHTSGDGVGTCCDTGAACDHSNGTTDDDCSDPSFCGTGTSDTLEQISFDPPVDFMWASMCASVATPTQTFVEVLPIGNHHDGTLDPGVQIVGNEISMLSGGRRIFLEYRVHNWDPNQEGVAWKAHEFGLDEIALGNEMGADIGFDYEVPCTVNSDCHAEFGAGTNCGNHSSTCYPTTGKTCLWSFVDQNHPDFIAAGLDIFSSVDWCNSALPHSVRVDLVVQEAGTIVAPDPFPESGLYAGTIILLVPPDAKGTYKARLYRRKLQAFSGGEVIEFIVPLGHADATIRVGLGRCCHDIANGPFCTDDLTQDECAALPQPTSFVANATCTDTSVSCSDCDDNSKLDYVELANGSGIDCNGNGTLDVCEAPAGDLMYFAEKNRYLTVDTRNFAPHQAIEVVFTDLAPPFDVFNGTVMYAGPPTDMSSLSTSVAPVSGFPTFKVSRLACSPHYDDWSAYGLVDLYHRYVVPSSAYTVATVSAPPSARRSASAIIATARFGDAVGNFDPALGGWTPPEGFVTAADFLGLLEAHANRRCGPRKTRLDMAPALPDGLIQVTDFVQIIDAFKAKPFPFAPGAQPCP